MAAPLLTTQAARIALTGDISLLVTSLPRGAITEIIGQRSSGCTAFLHAALATLLADGATGALVDQANAFDPVTALQNGVVLERLLLVRCDHHLDRALKTVDALLHVGGFGLVALDLHDVA